MSRALASDSRRRFLRHAAAGAGSGLLFGLIPWQDVLARASAAGIVPGTRVDAQGRPVDASAMTGYEGYVGEIILTPYNFAPRNYAVCNGQLMAIQTNTALFSLLGVTFGGDGRTTFGLPNLQGRLPRGQGQGPGLSPVDLGEDAGTAAVTLLPTEMPAHTHALPVGSGRRVRTTTATSYPAPTLEVNAYGTTTDGQPMAASIQGGSQPHANVPPFTVINFCICLYGVYPQRP